MGALRDIQREERREKERLDVIYKAEMSEMRSRHRQNEADLKQRHVTETETMRDTHAEERAKNVSRHNRRMADLESKYAEQRKALEPPPPVPTKRMPIEDILDRLDEESTARWNARMSTEA